MSYEPGTYVKDGKTRHAETKADAVAAVFEGFVLQDDASSEQSQVPSDEQVADEQVADEPEDGVNGVGTLGGGDFSEDDTPAPPAPTPSSVFGA